MKKFLVFLLYLSVFSPKSIQAAESAEERVMRPALLEKLLGDVIWPQELYANTSNSRFLICVYKDESIFKSFSSLLNGKPIGKGTFDVKLIDSPSKAKACHTIYFKSFSKQLANRFKRSPYTEKGLLFSEGKATATLGAHLSYYIDGDGFFKFELNLDSFARTGHRPNAGLFQLGNIVDSAIVNRANLMRSLIGYTEWPKSKALDREFDICSDTRSLFSQYVQFLFTSKQVKGKPTRFSYVSEKSTLDNCDVLLISDNKSVHLKRNVFNRDKQQLMLIGNGVGLGEKGTHYNLVPANEKRQKRFEINLVAMEQTGHQPHFQLLNSAHLIEKDIPSLGWLLINTILFTEWPVKELLKEEFNLCVWRSPASSQQLAFFIGELNQTAKPLKIIDRDKLDGLDNCDVVFATELSKEESVAFAEKQANVGFLLIASQADAKESGVQYNLKVARKKITLEMFENNLSRAGFKPKKQLQDIGVVIGGQVK